MGEAVNGGALPGPAVHAARHRALEAQAPARVAAVDLPDDALQGLGLFLTSKVWWCWCKFAWHVPLRPPRGGRRTGSPAGEGWDGVGSPEQSTVKPSIKAAAAGLCKWANASRRGPPCTRADRSKGPRRPQPTRSSHRSGTDKLADSL